MRHIIAFSEVQFKEFTHWNTGTHQCTHQSLTRVTGQDLTGPDQPQQTNEK